MIERFTAHAPGLSGPARRTLRTNLRFVAGKVVPQLCPENAPLPRERAKAPYSPAQIDGYLALADAQPTAARRMRAAGLVCLGAGAGLIRSDLRQVRGADVICRSGGVIVAVRGARPRAVPVLARYHQRLLTSAEFAGTGLVTGGTDPDRGNITNPLITALAGGTGLPRLDTSRLRATWLADCAALLGLATFLHAAGITCSQRLGDIIATLQPGDEAEAEIVARVGAWAGTEVLGKAVGRAITLAAPVTVRVVVPAQAGFLLGWPLELAHAGGRPLAARGDVTLVYDLQAPPAPGARASSGGARPAAGPVRVLAVFSLPTETSVLALRRERYELARLIREIGARERRQVEATFVQYGVTREKLERIADSGDGWDVLHLSGHGGAGSFLLETGDGSPDAVGTGDLVALLRPLRRRVRLAVVSACESAAATTAETLRWVGLTGQAEQLEQEQAEQLEQEDAAAQAQAGDRAGAGEVLTGIGRALVTELGCAVVAMRYPVTDEFAIAFTGQLYGRLLGGQGQSVGVAAARSVREAAGPRLSAARPAICLATPILIGAQAAGLRLQAPPGDPDLDPARQAMAYFPAEPERFVGRARAMARASAALAARSGRSGVLLHGMAGSGHDRGRAGAGLPAPGLLQRGRVLAGPRAR